VREGSWPLSSSASDLIHIGRSARLPAHPERVEHGDSDHPVSSSGRGWHFSHATDGPRSAAGFTIGW
jgi:hypothetical protein